MDLDEASPIAIALTKEFFAAMQRINPTWERAYWRFVSNDGHYGSNASYRTLTEVALISALKKNQLYNSMNSLERQLWNFESDHSRKFCICLLVINSNFDYEIKFEHHDENRWRITKFDGKSGLPDGL